MNKLLFIAVLIPSLLILPYLLSEEAYAYKLTNKEIKIEVFFVKDSSTNLPLLISDFESGIIEEGMYDTLLPVSVGQFDPSAIVADWDVNIIDDNNYKLTVNPIITEINISNGVSQPTIIGALIDDGRNQIRQWLINYGISDYTWYLYYEGGLIVIEEDNTPESFSSQKTDNVSIRDNIRTTVSNPAKIGTLTIIKEIITNTDGDAFFFSSTTLGDFDVVAVTGAGSVTFTGVDTRITHDVIELPKTGWTLQSAVCDNGETIDSIDFDDSLSVTCTFTNIKE